MTLSVSGDSITFPDLSTQLTAPSGFGFKNRIINGDMRIDQRNAGASVTVGASDNYITDRWMLQSSQASKFSAQQNAGAVTPPAGFVNYLGATSLAATSVGAGDYFSIQQRIEGLNCSDLAWGSANAQSVTLSFWVRSSRTGAFGGSLRNNVGNRSYPFSYSISEANTWEYKTINIAGDTGGTWLTTNGIGITVTLGLGVGSTYSGTTGSWSSNNYVSATGATSVVGTSGATFYITGVQLEKGSTATAFDYRDYGRELIMCQRYYEIMGDGNTQFAGITTSSIASFGYGWPTVSSQIVFAVQKRVAPTFVIITSLGSGSYSFTSAIDRATVAATETTPGYRYLLKASVSAEL
jgi:hypothetical protein